MNMMLIGRFAGPERRTRWWFWAVAYAYLVLLAGTNVPTPLYRGYQQAFGFSPTTVTLVFAAYVATLVPALLVLGPLSDALGRRRVLVPALLLAIVAAAIFLLARTTAWLFAARFAQGVAVGVGSGALVASLIELEPVGDRRRGALVATTAPVLGIAAGPLLSGLLAQYAPEPLTTPYVVEILLLVVALLLVTDAPDSVTRSPWRPRRPTVPASIRSVFAGSAATSFLAWAVGGLFLALIPSYVGVVTGSASVALAGAVVAAMLGCSACAQAVARRRPAREAMVVGLATLVVGCATLLVAGSTGSLSLLLVATAIAGAGHGWAFLGAMTAINAAAPPQQQADVVSTFLAATYLGTGVPVIGVGVLATHLGLLAAVEYFATALIGLAALFALVLHRTTRRIPSPR